MIDIVTSYMNDYDFNYYMESKKNNDNNDTIMHDGKDQANRLGSVRERTDFGDYVLNKVIFLVRELISKLKFFFRELKNDVSKEIKGFNRKRSIKKELTSVESMILNGVKNIKVFDCWSYCEAVTKQIEMLWKYADRFSHTKYPDLDTMDHDINIIEKMFVTIQKVLDDYKNKTVIIPINKYRTFLENELTGKSLVYSTMDYGISRLQKIDNLLNRQIDKYNATESMDIIQRRAGVFRRISNLVSNLTRETTNVIMQKAITGEAFR